MKKLLLLLIIPFLSFGQGWETTFGEENQDRGKSIQQTNDGGYIICGYGAYIDEVSGVLNNDIYLIKTNNIGTEEWSQMYGGGGDDLGESVQQTSDGGYILFGSTTSFGERDFYLIKLDPIGNEQWSQTYGDIDNDWGYSAQQTNDGGYIMFGYCAGEGDGLSLIKTDENGNEEWMQSYGSYPGDSGEVQQTNDGGYVFCGMSGKAAAIFKVDENGNEEWTQSFDIFYPSWNVDMANSVKQTNDGGYIVCGMSFWYSSGLQFDSYDVALIKTDQNGNEEWSESFGGYSEYGGFYDEGFSVQQTNDGGYIITGRTSSFGNGGSDLYLIKTNSYGEEQWFQTYGGGGFDAGYSVTQNTDGGYAICGEKTLNGNKDVYLIITDVSGNVNLDFHTTTLLNKKFVSTIDILGRETNNNKGLQLHIYDDGSVEKKYVIK